MENAGNASRNNSDDMNMEVNGQENVGESNSGKNGEEAPRSSNDQQQ